MVSRASFFCADFNFTCPQRLHIPARTWRSFQASQAQFEILAMQRLKEKKYKGFSLNGMSLPWKLSSIVLRAINYAALPTTGIQNP